MSERAKVTAKKSEANKENSILGKQKTNFSQAINSQVDDILHLQRTLGNQAVQRLVKSGLIQAKLKIGQPGDIYEQEADRVAEQVIRMSEPQLQRQSEEEEKEEEVIQTKPLFDQITPLVQKQKEEGEEKEEDKLVQTKAIAAQITPLVQRQEEEEEEALQTKTPFDQITPIVQRLDEEKEEEDSLQPKLFGIQSSNLVQRQTEREEEKEVQANFDIPTFLKIQRQEESEEEEEQAQANSSTVGASNSGYVPDNVVGRIASRKGSGKPLPGDVVEEMGERFGTDFGSVRVHTGSTAAELNRQLNAQAFAVGKDIYFGHGHYNPQSNEGKRLLAHELTHTVQQGAVARRRIKVSQVTTQRVQRGLTSWLVEKAKEKAKAALNLIAERTIPGYTLLTVILGKNIITSKPISRTGINIIKGYMRLHPVIGSILLSELEETKSLKEAGTWVDTKVAEMGINFNDIANRLRFMWEEMSWTKGIDYNVRIFKKHIGLVLGKFLVFSSVVLEKVRELRFEGALRLVGATKMLGVMKKDPKAFKRIVKKPTLIIKYFMQALRKGFEQFKSRFAIHFKNALFGWLFGKAAEMGVEMPKKFDLPGLFHLIAQLVGVTYRQIRVQIAKRLGPRGEAIVSKLESAFQLVKDLATRGPIALWDRVESMLSNLKEMIFPQVTQLVLTEIIKAAVVKLVSMLNPAGALIQAVLALYRVVKFFLDWWETIKELVRAILDTITTVALGQIDKAANFIEKIMAKAMKLVIAFLARVFGLGGIAQKVKKLIEKIGAPVRKAIGKVVDWIVGKARKLLGKVKKGAKAVKERIIQWWKVRKKFKTKSGDTHAIFFRGKGRNAKLMIATTVMVVGDAINLASSRANTAGEKQAVKDARALKNKSREIIKRLQSKGPGSYDPRDIDAINETLIQLAEVMKILLPLISGPAPISPSSLPVGLGDLLSYRGRHWILHEFGKEKSKGVTYIIVRLKKLVTSIKASNAVGFDLQTFAGDLKSGQIIKVSDKLSRRALFMGSQPSMKSDVGNAVKARMQRLGKYDPSTKRFLNARDNTWYNLSQAEMGHIIDASVWWNSNGRFKGPKSSEVRKFMKDPDNYELEEENQNRERGARAPNYLPPVT